MGKVPFFGDCKGVREVPMQISQPAEVPILSISQDHPYKPKTHLCTLTQKNVALSVPSLLCSCTLPALPPSGRWIPVPDLPPPPLDLA